MPPRMSRLKDDMLKRLASWDEYESGQATASLMAEALNLFEKAKTQTITLGSILVLDS